MIQPRGDESSTTNRSFARKEHLGRLVGGGKAVKVGAKRPEAHETGWRVAGHLLVHKAQRLEIRGRPAKGGGVQDELEDWATAGEAAERA